ncbi:zinc-dependent alcohol dehydrogenase [Alicyclobacillus kakegawensis]|uniref:zinc-dependent alcohol dehydrogenase n=1 Tax=Alicyclobacillus kakegawensis TaxID=392012 RepID=UPI000835F0B5|nr:alcohol dehydrogenase catalytic domain-containing protein [Alicyclobacillus kakegawensis]
MFELLLTEPGRLELHELLQDDRPLQPHEVRIRLLYGGICGSDLKVYQGKLRHAKYPVRPGHELLGRVIATGEAVQLPIGARVVVNPNTYCGLCAQCQRGRTNLCKQKESLGINIPGGFVEEFVVPAKYVVGVPHEVPDRLAVLTEPLAVAVHALKRAPVEPGGRMLILGCGTEGMLCALLARDNGCDVAVADVLPERLRWARSIIPGIEARSPEDYPDDSFSVVVEAAGSPSAVEQALRLIEPGGVVVLVGMAQEAVFPVQRFVRKEVSLHGSIIYVRQDFDDALQRLTDPQLQRMLQNIIGTDVWFEEFHSAYEYTLSGQPGKALLRWQGHPAP